MLAHVRDVVRTPGALPLFAASCVARLPMGAVGLLLVLHGKALTGSYAAGGLFEGWAGELMADVNESIGEVDVCPGEAK